MTFPTNALGMLAIASLAGAASASVTTLDPFVGDASEGYQSFGMLGGTPGPARIFDDSATNYDEVANFVMIADNLFSFITNTGISPRTGNRMGGFVTGQAVIDFDAPVSEFGGYFGTVDATANSMILLYDTDGALISTEPMVFEIGEWNWHGWSSETPISRVEIHANPRPGLPMVIDDLQITYAVPAPASAVLLGLSGLAAGRRRRK